MLADLTISDFVGHVNDSFRIALGTEELLELQLIEARTIGESRRPAAPGLREQPFSLIFKSPRDRLLAQRIYPIEHPALGTLEIFLVPLGPAADATGLHYQAVFN